MSISRSVASTLLVAFALAIPAGASDPSAKWLTIYGWIQTAERLATAGQWPLALGSYLEADRQIQDLAQTHPDFEPEMVNYRRGRLVAAISETEARLTTDEHEVMMKYLDFIESLELGEALRYGNEYEAAYTTLGMAKAVLDEVIGKKPGAFREAVASQYARLESSLAWLDSQIQFTAVSRPGTAVDDSTDWGTTRFVKAADLPTSRPEASVTSELFPVGLVSDSALDPFSAGSPARVPSAASSNEDGSIR
jgi:hypothetical protein